MFYGTVVVAVYGSCVPRETLVSLWGLVLVFFFVGGVMFLSSPSRVVPPLSAVLASRCFSGRCLLRRSSVSLSGWVLVAFFPSVSAASSFSFFWSSQLPRVCCGVRVRSLRLGGVGVSVPVLGVPLV